MKDKKSLYLIVTGIGLITTIAVAVFSTSNTSLFKSLAGGIVHTSDKGRTLTLDSSTPLVVDVDGKGNVSLGNIAAFSPECTAITNGVANIGTRGIVVYCPTAEKNGDYYRGFAGSTVTNVSITFDGGNSDTTVYATWGRTNGTSIGGYGTGVSGSMNVVANTKDQTFTFNNTNDAFLVNQDTPKTASNKYSCIYIYVNGSDKTVDLVSLEVQYSCN